MNKGLAILLVAFGGWLPTSANAQWSISGRVSQNIYGGTTTRAEFVDGVLASLRPESGAALEATVERQFGRWAVAIGGLRAAPNYVLDQESLDVTPELASPRLWEVASELHRVLLSRTSGGRASVFAGPQVSWWRPPGSDNLWARVGARGGVQGDLPLAGPLLVSLRAQVAVHGSPIEEGSLQGTLLERRATTRFSFGVGLRRTL